VGVQAALFKNGKEGKETEGESKQMQLNSYEERKLVADIHQTF